MNKNINSSKDNSLLVFILTLGVFSILNTEMGVIGILPMISQVYGVEISTAGLLVSLFALTVALSGPVLPLVFSKYNRKYIMLISLGMFFICNVISAFADDFTVVLIVRVLPAFLHPVYISLALAVASSAVEPKNIPKAIANVMVGVSGGMVIGVPIVSYIASISSLEMAMLSFAFVNLLALLATVVWVPSLPVTHKMAYGTQLRVLKEKNVWLAIFGLICLNGSIFGVFGYLAKYLETITQLSAELTSITLFLYGVANVLGNFIAGRILSIRPVLFVAVSPFLLAVLYVIILLWGDKAVPMIMFVCIWGVLSGAAGNINQYWITSATPHALDFGNALFLVATNIGASVAVYICGIFIDTMGINQVFLGGLLFLILSAVFILWRIKQEKQAYVTADIQ